MAWSPFWRFASVLEWRLDATADFSSFYSVQDPDVQRRQYSYAGTWRLKMDPPNQQGPWSWSGDAVANPTLTHKTWGKGPPAWKSTGKFVRWKDNATAPRAYLRIPIDNDRREYEVSAPGPVIKDSRTGDEDQLVTVTGLKKLPRSKDVLAIEGSAPDSANDRTSTIRYTWNATPIKFRKYRELELKLRIFIPAPFIHLGPEDEVNPTPISAPVQGGDDRGYSYDEGTHRAQQRVVVSLDPTNRTPVVSEPECEFGETTSYEHALVRNPRGRPNWWFEAATGFRDNDVIRSRVKRTQENNHVEVAWLEELFGEHPAIQLRFRGAASVPSSSGLVRKLAPAIDWDIGVFLWLDEQSGKFRFKVGAQHDGFPAYELYLNRRRIYGYDPTMVGAGPWSLAPPMEIYDDKQEGVVP